mgnify:CR=1 FL=1
MKKDPLLLRYINWITEITGIGGIGASVIAFLPIFLLIIGVTEGAEYFFPEISELWINGIAVGLFAVYMAFIVAGCIKNRDKIDL